MAETAGQKSRLLTGILVTIIIILVGVVAFLWGARSGQGDAPAVEASQVADADKVKGDRLAAARQLVIGANATRRVEIGGGELTEKAARLIETPFGPVLLTEATAEESCHACVGFVGAYYLREKAGRFEVAASYPDAMSGWGWGNAPEDWSVVDRFTQYPALYFEGGGGNQGIMVQGATIVELTPDGPKTSKIDLGGSDASSEEGGADFTGKIANVVRGQSFDVNYSGSCSGTLHYTLQGGVFQPSGTNPCAGQLESIQ